MNLLRLPPAAWIVAGVLALFFNSAYLYAAATASLPYFVNVAAHPLLGLAVAVAGALWLGRTRPHVPWWLWAGLGPLAAGLALGGIVLWVGATRPYRWLLDLHIVLSAVGSAPVLWYLVRQARARAGLAATAVAVASLLVVLAGGGAWVWSNRREAARAEAFRVVNPALVPASMHEEGAGAGSPFFPSSAETNVGGVIPADFFLTSESCARCHKDIYDQWNSSAHHFSSFNNQWYRKSIEYMQDVVGTRPSKWCAGCHDHAVFFNGRFDRPIKEQLDTPEAQAGLGCMSCHAITKVKSTMGQGDFVIEYPALHDLATSEQPLLRWAHDKLLELDPQPHREAFLKPFHTSQTPEFCSTCHKVHLDKPVNDYRWFRGFNDYDNWQASGVSGEGARSFYYPIKAQKCADCHMPLVASDDPAAKNGRVKSHRFPAANTALPYANRDPVQLEAVQNFLRDGQVSVDVFGLVRGGPADVVARGPGQAAEPQLSSTFAVGEESMSFGAVASVLTPAAEVLAPLDKVNAVVRRGESVRIEVVVRTRKVGHFFPGGTVDAFDVWVEFEAVDDQGRAILHSGAVADDGKGPVEPSAHFYRSLMLDEQGHPIDKRNAWMTRSVAYVRLIPPGAADTVHYRLLVPEDAGDRITLRAKVNYRKFSWWLTQWAYAGMRDPADADFSIGPGHDDGRWVFTAPTTGVSGKIKAIPDIPTTVMAEHATSLQVVDRADPLPEVSPYFDRAVRERWNDYGIGLLLQGDLRGAEAAFLGVTRMDPEYADGWVNVARVRLQEGNVTGAEEMLRRALEVDPDLAKTHFFLGTALKSLGQYDEALRHLRRAAEAYPRDRVVRNQIGRVLFLKRLYREAIAEFGKALEVDPEDLQAHYNLMLAYQGLGDTAAVARERALYERFKADEAAQAITGPYRQLHPYDNNERQSVHEHGPGALEPKGGEPKRGARALPTTGPGAAPGPGARRRGTS